MPSIKEMREICQQRRPNAKGKMVWAGHWFNRLVVRWFSIYITWLCVKFNISANTCHVSYDCFRSCRLCAVHPACVMAQYCRGVDASFRVNFLIALTVRWHGGIKNHL